MDMRFRMLREVINAYSENMRTHNENVAEYSRTIRIIVNMMSDVSVFDTAIQEPRLLPSQIDAATQIIEYDCDTMNDTQCPIGLDDFVEHEPLCQIIYCRHTFKRQNLFRWFDTHTCCPVCRHNLLEREQEQEPDSIDQIAQIITSYVNEHARNLDPSGNSTFVQTFQFPLQFRR